MKCSNCNQDLKKGNKKVIAVERKRYTHKDYVIRYSRCLKCLTTYKTIEFRYPKDMPLYKLNNILQKNNLIA